MKMIKLAGFLAVSIISAQGLCAAFPGGNRMPEGGLQNNDISCSVPATPLTDRAYIQGIDWNKALRLKEKLLMSLDSNTMRVDWLLTGFLAAYEDIIDEVNKKLYDEYDYDSLMLMMYNPDLKTLEATRFENNILSHGFSIGMAEGEVYIKKNTDFIRQDLYSYLDSTSTVFLNLYCEEIDKPCCADAGFIISTDTVINRAFSWGELLKVLDYSEYYAMVDREFTIYLYFVFNGLDNTPFFDWDSGLYDKRAFDLMQDVIEQYPESNAARYFRSFCDMLKASNMKKNKEISMYLEELYNSIPPY